MDSDDCDVLTGWDQPEKSPQRLVSDQVYGTPASTPFSNFVATADPLIPPDDGLLNQSPGCRLRPSETSSVACSPAEQSFFRSPACKSDHRSPNYSPSSKPSHGQHRKHEAEREFQWLGAPEATVSPAQAKGPETTRLERAGAQSSSAAALHALKASMEQFGADENQGSDANTTAAEQRGSLHLPAFERLMQVMHRLEQTTEDDNGDTTSVMSGPVSYAHQSPSKHASPPQLSRPTPFDAQRTPASATSQDVASHPITIGNASSPTPVAPRPMLLHRDIDPSPLCLEPEPGTDVQQPWQLKTPSMLHSGRGCTETLSRSGLDNLEGANSVADHPGAAEQHSMSSDQRLRGTRDDMQCVAVPTPVGDEISELAALRASISSRGTHTQPHTARDKQRYETSPSRRCSSSSATNIHSAGGETVTDANVQELSEHSGGVTGGKLVDQDDPSLRSPFPDVGEVPWPTPGNAYLRPDKAPEVPSESQAPNHVQQGISMEWEPINTRLSAANITGVQHDAHDWPAFENSVHKALSCLLGEYEKQGHLVQQLLSVADGASTEKTRHAAALKTLQRQRDSLENDLKREKEASSKRDALHKKEMAKTKSQVKTLEGTIKKLHRDAEAAAKASSRQGMERHALETTTNSTQAELADLKKRVSALSDSLAKAQAESKRLQGYTKQLEAAQRLKDAQLTELGEHKSDSGRRIDELERACTAATKDAQQHEAQVSSLHRQLREAQVAVRNAEKEASHQQGESSRLSTQSEMAEQRAHECETALKDATAQMRSLTSRITALEAQLRAKESEAEEIQATMTASRKGSSEIEARGIQLQADLRGACADIASLTAQLGVQTAVAQSRDVEIEELKAAVREAGVRQEAAGDALDDTVGENKRLSMQCAQLQCSLKTQVAALRARESELDDVRASYTAAEVRADNLCQRLKVSGLELAKAEEALKLSQRQARSLGNRLHESESQCEALQASLQSVESKKGDAQVQNKSTAQQLAGARAEADRVRAALQAAENQLSAKDERISALHADLHLLDAQKDELKHAFADASGAVASAADNSSALESRTRALQAQLRERDEVEAVMKEQLSSLRGQRDKLEDTLKEHIKRTTAADSAKAAEASRIDSLRSQLAARGQEADALRSQLSLVEDEMTQFKSKNAKFEAEIEIAERSRQAQDNKISVLSNHLGARDEESATLKAQLKAMDETQSTAQNAAEASHREMWRSDAMLSAERDRARLLEKQLSDAQEAYSTALQKQEEADADSRAAKAKAIDSERRCAHLEAQVKTLQGRVKVLDTQLKGCQQEEVSLREALLEAQSERGSSAHTAAKESSALSASLRASHARTVVLEKQLAERDQQITSLRVQVSQAHAESGGAAQHSRDAAGQILVADQRAKNLAARNQLMQTQMAALQEDIEGLREALNDEKKLCKADVASAAEAAMNMRALHAQISNLRSSVKIVEHQLAEKTDEAERLRAMLAMHDDSAQTAAAAIVSAQLAEASRDQALEDSRKRASCLQRRLDVQQCALQAAQADATAANDAADESRRQVAHLAGEVHRATLRADAAVAHASGLDAALISADADLAEVRNMMLQQHTESGTANAEASTHTAGLEAQVRGLTGRLQVLEKQLQDRNKLLETAEKSTGDMADKLKAASVKAAQHEGELQHLQSQIKGARKAHEQALAVAAERNAELEMLRSELSELLLNQDAMAQAGAETIRSEKVLRAGLRGLDSELRSVHAAIAKKDADALAADEALANCRDAYREARSEAAAAHERCEVLRKQVRSLQSTVQRHAAVAQAAQDGVQEAQQAALDEAKRADDVEAHVADLEKSMQRFNVQQAALQAAQEKHDIAVTKAAEAVADARKIATSERENSAKARQNASDAGALVEAMQQELQQLRSAHDAQLHASDAATAATRDLQQALLDQQTEVRDLAAQAAAAAANAASSSREVAALQSQLLTVKVQLHEQTEALVLAEQQLQQSATERVAEHVDAVRAAESLERAGANVESLHRELGQKDEGVEALRQRLADSEAQLQQERQNHGATRAEQASAAAALDRKVAALQNSEAEKSRLAVSLKHTEEMVKELTHAKLEGTAQDAASRKAQHVNEISLRHAQEQIAQLGHQLQAVTEVKNEQSQAIKALEGSLAEARVDAAQRNVADSASAAAAVRGEADIRHLQQRIGVLQQEQSDLTKEKQALERQAAHAADERIKSSEELGRAAKAMLLAQSKMQKQIESLKKKGASQAASLRETRAEADDLRRTAMDAQMELKQSHTDGPHVRKLEAEVSSLRDKLHEAQLQKHAEAEARQQVSREAGQFEESAESAAVQLQHAKEEASNLQRECGHLKLQVTQLTHSLREGEKRLEKTREQLAASISKEERFQTRGKQAYARIRAAWACAKGTSKAAGALAAASREMRPVEIVSIYEEQKAQVEADVKRLSAENAVLLSQVRDLENKVTLASRELSNSGAPVAAELQAQLAESSRTVGQLRAEVQRQDVEAGDAARVHARQLAEAQGRTDMLQEENATLLVELNNRPSHKDYTGARREAEIMRQRLNRLEASKGSEFPDGHDSPDAEKQPDRRLMTTKDRIARDKRIAALGLSHVDRLPLVVLAEIVQDACLALDVTEPTHLHASVLRVLRRANQVPQLEQFVDTVTDCIFKRGAQLVPMHLQSADTASVVPVLELWQEQLHEATLVDTAMHHIHSLVHGRNAPAPPSLNGTVSAVHQLVQNQSNAQATLDTFRTLDADFKDSPGGSIVRHFQNLFSVQSTAGCIPMMSKIYAEHRAGVTFLQALSDMLRTPCSSAACLDRVEVLLSTSAGRELQLKKGIVEQLQPSRNPHTDNTQHASNSAAADEMSMLLQQVCNLLGCDSSGVLPALQHMQTRLLRFDGLLPKYQQVLSHVYAALRISSLDEVVPAMERLMNDSM